MTDPRYTKLAKLLVDYSPQLNKGDRVLIDAIDIPDDFTVELMRAVRQAGAVPLVEVRHSRVTREVLRGTNDDGGGIEEAAAVGRRRAGEHLRTCIRRPAHHRLPFEAQSDSSEFVRKFVETPLASG